MTRPAVERIADALLCEGYVLYPYRATAVKNRQRWTFGALVPPAYAEAAEGTEASLAQTQILVLGREPQLSVRVRFLHPLRRVVGEPALPGGPADGVAGFRPVEALRVGDRVHHTWQEATERDVCPPDLAIEQLVGSPHRAPFRFPAWRAVERVSSPGGDVRVVERSQEGIDGEIEVSAERIGDGLFRAMVRVCNRTPLANATSLTRDEVMLRSLVSTHTILNVRGGRFVSLLDPPAELSRPAAGCQNVGTWPVLVGEEGRGDTMLSSPIILYDYPRVAPESPGDFFDGTEIDELLALRILTMTAEERRQMADLDPRTRALLGRTEAMTADDLARLHGAARPAGPGPRPGDRVRLRPRGRADAFDLLLAGKAATVASVEHDFDGRTHLCVTVDDDPGRDLGETGMPGHRFFYRPDEVEPLPPGDGEGL